MHHEKTADAMWRTEAQREIFETLQRRLALLDGVKVLPRRAYVLFARAEIFAAAKPSLGRSVRLAMAAPAEICARLDPPGERERWPKRLSSVLPLLSPEDLDAEAVRLLELAWSQS